MKKILFTCTALLPALVCYGHAHAVDSTAFDPTRVRVQAQNAIPVGTIIAWHATGNPADMRNPDGTYNWLECNGQAVSKTVYPELFALVGGRTPDFKGQFLRGLDAGHGVGDRVEDTFKTHVHGQPEHTHSWNGQLASTALTGTAKGQRYVDAHTAIDPSPSEVQGPNFEGPVRALGTYVPNATSTAGSHGGHGESGYSAGSHSHSLIDGWKYLYYASIDIRNKRQAEDSGVTGSVTNGTVNGTVGASGGDDTYATGDAETAPKHVYVRYLIRARP